MIAKRHFAVMGALAAALLVFVGFGCGRGMRAYPPTSLVTSPDQSELSSGQVANAVEDWVDARGGSIMLEDPLTGNVQEARLVSVRRDWMGYVGDNTWFIPAKFEARDGTVFDTDVFMKGTNRDNLFFQDLSVREVDGQQLYSWKRTNGAWERANRLDTREQRQLHRDRARNLPPRGGQYRGPGTSGEGTPPAGPEQGYNPPRNQPAVLILAPLF